MARVLLAGFELPAPDLDRGRAGRGEHEPGLAAALTSAGAFVLLYRTLAIGPMNVLSPVTALVSAALPVGVGLLQGEHLAVAGMMGLPVALVAVVPVSAGPKVRSAGRSSSAGRCRPQSR